jgi:hypothetical protein
MHTFRKTLVSLALVATFCSKTYHCTAQIADTTVYNEPHKVYYMAGADVGLGYHASLHYAFNATLMVDKYWLTAKMGHEEYLDLTFSSPPQIRLSNTQYALLAGKNVLGNAKSYFVLSTGISIVDVETNNRTTVSNVTAYGPEYNYQVGHRFPIGLPIEFTYFNNYLSKHVPFVAVAAVNLNTVSSYFSVGIGLQLGNTRERRIKTKN